MIKFLFKKKSPDRYSYLSGDFFFKFTSLSPDDCNLHSHEGSDAKQFPHSTEKVLFQSTLPRGERLQIYTNILTYSCKIFLFFSFSIYSLSLSIKFHLSFSHFSGAKLSMFLCILGVRTYSYRISVSSAEIP